MKPEPGKPRLTALLLALSAAAAVSTPAPAYAAKTLCCVNAQGRNVCGDILPQECYGRAYREVSERGITLRQIDAPLTAEQRAQREADLERKKQEEILAREEQRRNEALLNTYANEKDIDFMRERALNAVSESAKESQTKYAEALKRRQKLAGELEFYTKKPPPDSLKEQIKANETDLKALVAAVEAKKREMEQVTARFAEEKKRYLELKQGGSRKVSAATTPAIPGNPAAPAGIKPR